MPRRRARFSLVVLSLASLGLTACVEKTPLVPVNRRPIVHSLVAFPATIAPGDSAVVVCFATDPDGDSLVFDWSGGGPLRLRPHSTLRTDLLNAGNAVTAYPETSQAFGDTGAVSCHVRDRRGGGAHAGRVLIAIQR